MADISAQVSRVAALAIVLFLCTAAVVQAEPESAAAATDGSRGEASPAAETAGAETCAADTNTDEVAAAGEPALTHIEEVKQFEEQLKAFKVERADAVPLFNRLRDATRMRLWQFDMALDNAKAVTESVTIDPAEIERQHPGFPEPMYQLPANINSILDLYNDTQDLFWARNRALKLLPPEAYQQAVGTALYGVQELGSELDLIVVEARYQVLRLPRAWQQIKTMAVQAPVPLIWIVVQFWLAIVIFRWWRRWLPDLLQRMRASFLAMRPRTEEIMLRLRGLWYLDQVRQPLEWLLFFGFLFGLVQFDGIELILEVVWIILRWVLLGWFAVAVLNAIAARGAGGLAGESASLRLQSMRLIAAWLVLLGLGIELSTTLVGEAALEAWVWRAFQLAAFPVVLRLLSIWHVELYSRLEPDGDGEMSLEERAQQRGLQRWVSAAKAAGYLIAGYFSSVVLRRIEQFDPVRTASARLRSATQDNDKVADKKHSRLDPEKLQALYEGYDEFAKYGRQERRDLVTRIEAGESGIVVVVGERGIGRNGFLRQVAGSHEHKTLYVSGWLGSFAAIEAALYEQLGVGPDAVSDTDINKAIVDADVRFVVITDIHLLMRPKMGGFVELTKLNALFDRVKAPCVWALSCDRYAWQLINRARSSYTTADTIIRLRPWTDEQISEFIDTSCASIELDPDFTKVRVPRRYMDSAEDNLAARNRAGIYNMIASMSRGNPSIAIRLFGDSLRLNEDDSIEVTLPVAQDDQLFEGLSLAMLLVLRTVAQCDLVTADDVVENLRMDKDLIGTTLHFAELRGWIECIDLSDEGQRSGYRVSWTWFRTITRVLGRKNLLAGVAEESV